MSCIAIVRVARLFCLQLAGTQIDLTGIRLVVGNDLHRVVGEGVRNPGLQTSSASMNVTAVLLYPELRG